MCTCPGMMHILSTNFTFYSFSLKQGQCTLSGHPYFLMPFALLFIDGRLRVSSEFILRRQGVATAFLSWLLWLLKAQFQTTGVSDHHLTGSRLVRKVWGLRNQFRWCQVMFFRSGRILRDWLWSGIVLSTVEGSLACCSPWGLKELDTAEWLNNSNRRGQRSASHPLSPGLLCHRFSHCLRV